MAQLTERVSNLVDASRTHGQKLDSLAKDLQDVSKEVHGAKVGFKVGVAIVGLVVTGSVGFIAWLITKVLPAVLASLK